MRFPAALALLAPGAGDGLVVYPAPPGLAASPDPALAVNGKPVWVERLESTFSAKDVSREGIILVHGVGGNVPVRGTKRVAIRSLKIIGARRGKSGGRAVEGVASGGAPRLAFGAGGAGFTSPRAMPRGQSPSLPAP